MSTYSSSQTASSSEEEEVESQEAVPHPTMAKRLGIKAQNPPLSKRKQRMQKKANKKRAKMMKLQKEANNKNVDRKLFVINVF